MAPLAIQGQSPAPGIFPFDKYSSAYLLINAIREDVARRGRGTEGHDEYGDATSSGTQIKPEEIDTPFVAADPSIQRIVDEEETAANGENDKQFLYRGIAGRNFERRFQLADHVKVVGAKLANGLLTIELQREIPEEKKPRAIPVVADGQPALTH